MINARMCETGDDDMTAVLIGGLTALSGYLGLLLLSARSENTTLRVTVASLKKQLAKRRS